MIQILKTFNIVRDDGINLEFIKGEQVLRIDADKKKLESLEAEGFIVFGSMVIMPPKDDGAKPKAAVTEVTPAVKDQTAKATPPKGVQPKVQSGKANQGKGRAGANS